MPIQNIPEIFIANPLLLPDLFVYDFRMTDEVVKSKVDLSLHMFSFLQTGQKRVHFADAAVAVNEHQSLLIKKGNCLMTELLNKNTVYFCKLLFFSQKKIEDFLQKHTDSFSLPNIRIEKDVPFFVIENDQYIKSFIQSLCCIQQMKDGIAENLLVVKFEEIMLYLLHKYQEIFVQYLGSLISSANYSSFRKTVDLYTYSNLRLEEIAFLCNMSLSTFKRHFINEYQVPPGKWLLQKRLIKAKEILRKGLRKPSDIYADSGYNNFSNFCTAFKNEFGYSPHQVINKH